ncbi:MAG: hypothetical protein R3C24_17270 [Cyanobacteriota/Melainabacteria group bacterium]
MQDRTVRKIRLIAQATRIGALIGTAIKERPEVTEDGRAASGGTANAQPAQVGPSSQPLLMGRLPPPVPISPGETGCSRSHSR